MPRRGAECVILCCWLPRPAQTDVHAERRAAHQELPGHTVCEGSVTESLLSAGAAPGKAFQGGRLSIWEPQKGAGGSREKAPELPAGVVGLGTMQPAPVRAQWYFLALFFLASCLVPRRGISL